jgi:hypothetical protein
VPLDPGASGGTGGTPKQKLGALTLTDLKARQATPRDRDYKLAHPGGLYLFVTTKRISNPS